MIYGGLDNATGNVVDDTWIYSGGSWNSLCVTCGLSVSPGPRWGATMVYSYDWVMLFGGCSSPPSGGLCPSGALVFSPYVWCVPPTGYAGWSSSGWHSVTGPSGAPFGANFGIMNMSSTSDPAQSPGPSDLAIFFGGMTAGGVPQNYTWGVTEGCTYNAVYDTYYPGTPTWAIWNPSRAPSPRWGNGFSYDYNGSVGSGSNFILFGGRDGSQAYSDTWEFSSGCSQVGPACNPAWTIWVCPGGGNPTPPAARIPHMASAGSTTSNLFIWGGGNYFSGLSYNDSWIWSPLGGWTNITSTNAPPSPPFRLQGMFTYDDGRAGNSGGVYLFGGTADYNTNSGRTYDDLWYWH
jgi:hypothetical protein